MDPKLDAIVHSILNYQGTLRAEQAAGLIAVWSDEPSGVSDLRGIECFPNIGGISLRGSEIKDISPLSALVRLSVLYLDNNQIADISPLSNLSELEWLTMSANYVSDLSALRFLPKLWIVVFDHNQITALSPLEAPYLGFLNVSDNQITTLAPLLECPSMNEMAAPNVWVQNNPIDCNAEAATIRELLDRGVYLATSCP